MESFRDLIRVRRSMRKFTDEELTQEETVTLLRAGLIAPSSKGLHGWEFVVVDDKETIHALSMCKSQGADFISGAPLVVVVLGDPTVSDVWIEDASVAATMMLLQAEDLGLGACWVQVRERMTADGEQAENIVRGLLGIPEHLRVLAMITVGHKGMERKPFNEDRLLWEKVHVGKF